MCVAIYYQRNNHAKIKKNKIVLAPLLRVFIGRLSQIKGSNRGQRKMHILHESGHGCTIIISIFALLSLCSQNKTEEKCIIMWKYSWKKRLNNDDIKKVCAEQKTNLKTLHNRAANEENLKQNTLNWIKWQVKRKIKVPQTVCSFRAFHIRFIVYDLAPRWPSLFTFYSV